MYFCIVCVTPLVKISSVLTRLACLNKVLPTYLPTITEEAKIIYEKVCKNPKPRVMSEAEAKQHARAKRCYACGIKFGTLRPTAKGEMEEVTKCWDHCHITGKYRGAACNKCNLRMRLPNFIPVLFHNLEGYDSHLFVKSLGLTEGDIKRASQ